MPAAEPFYNGPSAAALKTFAKPSIEVVEACAHIVKVDTTDVFVIIRWPEDHGLPRYSFATVPHAAEIAAPIERVQTCSSIQAAASITARLNAEEAATA